MPSGRDDITSLTPKASKIAAINPIAPVKKVGKAYGKSRKNATLPKRPGYNFAGRAKAPPVRFQHNIVDPNALEVTNQRSANFVSKN
jgi:hypothetical protein